MRFSNVIPTPKEVSPRGGSVAINSEWGIDDRSGYPDIGKRCAGELNLSNDRRKSNVTFLREDGLTVAEVARQCGFSSPRYFASAFRRSFHCTPTEYRTAAAAPRGSKRRVRARDAKDG